MTEDEFNKLILIALVRPEVLPLIIEDESNNENDEEKETNNGKR